jgi:hypothetical protein
MMNIAFAATMMAGLASGQCDPPGGGDFVTVRAIVLDVASGLDTTTGSPPTASTSILQGANFVVELWVQQTDATLQGFNCVYADVIFDDGFMSCSAPPTVAPLFTDFGSNANSCSGGTTVDLGGCNFSPPDDLGLTPDWARVATLPMTADLPVGSTNLTADQASDPLRTISVLGCGNVPVSRISFEGSIFTILSGACGSDPECDDGLFCNGSETCNIGVGCVSGTDPCGGAPCNEATDSCVGVCSLDVDCDDGEFCDGDEICDPGDPGADANGCVEADFGPCFFTMCDEFNDECVQCFQNSQCNDDLACNGQETCVNNECVNGAPVDCPGMDPATPFCNESIDSCTECTVNGHCDDGLFCNGAETCDIDGTWMCMAGTSPCDDGVACTVDTCDDVLDECTYTPDDGACADGAFCNGDEVCDDLLGCLAGAAPCPIAVCDEGGDVCGACATAAECDDGIPCTEDTCEGNMCLNRPEDDLCDNDVFCDGPEVCDPLDLNADASGCIAAASPPNCSDGVLCTVDDCNESLNSCVNTSSNALCDNGSYCDGLEACDPDDMDADVFGCIGSDAIDCDDGSTCTEDFCSDVLQACVNSSSGCPGACPSAFQRVDLEWRPANLQVSDVDPPILFEVDLYAVPNGPGVEVQGMQVIIGWDPAIVAIQEFVGVGSYPWIDDGYPDDSGIDNINDGLNTPPLDVPFNDGNALIALVGDLPEPFGIGPNVIDVGGELVATVRFSVVDPGGLNTNIDFIEFLGCTCSTVFWAGKPGCGIEDEFFSAHVTGPCLDDCADADDNGVIDDICTFQDCVLNTCNLLPRTFPADMGGAFGACPKDDFCNIHDRTHALNCFAGQNACDSINHDAGGAFGACPPDGFCNIHDANHALNCFSGTNICNNSCGPMPEFEEPDRFVSSYVGVTAVANRREASPGDIVQVRIFVDEPLDNLQAYQLEPAISGGSDGALELLQILVENRKDAAFRGEIPFEAFNTSTGQMLSGLDQEGVETWADAYLATFVYRVSEDASGSFVVDIAHDELSGDQTFLIADFVEEIVVDRTEPAIIRVHTTKDNRRARVR